MKCNYRNCSNEITEGLKGKIYCCRNCKENEKTYRTRANKPKKALGRPKSIWKLVNELTPEDLQKLMEINGFSKKIYPKEGI